jgi:hypothetical protein
MAWISRTCSSVRVWPDELGHRQRRGHAFTRKRLRTPTILR